MKAKTDRLYNQDCIEGCQEHFADNSVDLIVTDPPYGIEGDTLHKHYHRKEEFVLDGYIEVPRAQYTEFSEQWIAQAERILRPGGSIYIVSGHTHLIDILNALRKTKLREVNHLIWKYNFGVFTTQKYVTAHYHILYYVKPGRKPTFNTYCRYGQKERNEENGSLNYRDREDVWIINKEYKQGKIKNKNELPYELLKKIVQYSSNESDIVCDLFLGGFASAVVAKGLNRFAWGFELSPVAFKHNYKKFEQMERGAMLPELLQPQPGVLKNRGKSWTEEEIQRLAQQYDRLYEELKNKQKAIDALSEEWGRGYFSLLNVLKRTGR